MGAGQPGCLRAVAKHHFPRGNGADNRCPLCFMGNRGDGCYRQRRWRISLSNNDSFRRYTARLGFDGGDVRYCISVWGLRRHDSDYEGYSAVKKLGFGLVLGTVMSLVAVIGTLAANITNATYQASITVTNNGTATANQATIFTLNTTYLINQSFVNSALNNTALINNIGNDNPFMPGAADNQPWVVWVSTIGGAVTNDPYVLYMGGNQSMSSNIAYFPGTAGMNVTDNASLELGGNFTINQTAWVDTTAGANKNLVYKPGAITANISSQTLNVTVNLSSYLHTLQLPATVAGDTLLVLIAGNTTTTNTTLPVGWTSLIHDTYAGLYGGVMYDAWNTTASTSSATNLTYISNTNSQLAYVVYRISGANNITFSTAAKQPLSQPDCPSLTVTNNQSIWLATAAGNRPALAAVFQFAPTGFTNVTDAVMLSPSVLRMISSNLSQVAYTVDPSIYQFSNAMDFISYTVAVSGVSQPVIQTITSSIDTVDPSSIISVSKTGISSGLHTIAISLNGNSANPQQGLSGNLTISLDGATVNGTSCPGAITDNGNDWQFCTANATPYVYGHQIKINGTLQQNVTWQYSSTLPVYFYDLTGRGHTATPTMRTTATSVNVTANMTTFSPIAQSSSTVTNPNIASYNLTSNFTTPAGLYTELNLQFPGAAWLDEILNSVSIPRALVWFPIIFGFINLIGLGMFAVTKSVMIQAVTMGFLVMMASVMGGFGYWVVIEYTIMALAVVLANKQFGW